MSTIPDAYRKGCETLVHCCAGLQPGERALVLSDATTEQVGVWFAAEVERVTSACGHRVIAPLTMHGQEPPREIAAQMAASNVVFCLTRMSLAHSLARKAATDGGTRFLSLPDYSPELLASPSLQVDFKALVPEAERLTELLQGAQEVAIRTGQGTELRFAVRGRIPNCCPGLCREPGALASPPDAEVNVAPWEESAHGTVCVDGSIPCAEIGLLDEPVLLEIGNGRITEFRGERRTVAALERIFDETAGASARQLAEFGIGLNPRAQLSGRMLEDEGCAGTIHLGFGSNITIGGRNRAPLHLDFVVREPTVWFDDRLVLGPESAAPRNAA